MGKDGCFGMGMLFLLQRGATFERVASRAFCGVQWNSLGGPHMTQSHDRREIIIYGYPKSGSVWLARLLGDALNSPIISKEPYKSLADEGHDRPGPYVIRQQHVLPDPLPEDTYVIGIIRDPRDVAVSAFHYWEMMSVRQAIRCMAEGEWPLPHGGGWKYFIQDVRLQSDMVVTYSALIGNIEEQLSHLVWFFDDPVDVDLEAVIARQSIDARRKVVSDDMPYGSGIQRKLLRRGIVGAWRDEMNLEARKAAHEAWWEQMHLLGFESDPDWWRMD